MRYVHTNLIAKDCFVLSLFYQKVFGCKPIEQKRDLSGEWLDELTAIKDVHIVGEHLLLPGFDEDGPTLEIFTYSCENACIREINTCGFSHIAFEVIDVKAAVENVIQEGGTLLGKIVTKDYGNMRFGTFAYTKDPEGNMVELQSWQKV